MDETLKLILAELQKTNSRMDTMETRFDAMETRFDTMETRIDEMDAKFTARFNQVDSSIADLKERMERIECVVEDTLHIVDKNEQAILGLQRHA